jgi:hypothetical protein
MFFEILSRFICFCIIFQKTKKYLKEEKKKIPEKTCRLSKKYFIAGGSAANINLRVTLVDRPAYQAGFFSEEICF